MRAATSSRSQFLASVCIREPRDGQGVRDATRDGLGVAQLGFCLVLHAICTISTGRIRSAASSPKRLALTTLWTLAECSGHRPAISTHPALKTYPPHR